jgi:hypothetical protein
MGDRPRRRSRRSTTSPRSRRAALQRPGADQHRSEVSRDNVGRRDDKQRYSAGGAALNPRSGRLASIHMKFLRNAGRAPLSLQISQSMMNPGCPKLGNRRAAIEVGSASRAG